ncbi:MAG: DUF2344 domain-containing protein [Clostridia bacterium]|nr:DUF2344 domain-containing protein [Clostridia bacterium]
MVSGYKKIRLRFTKTGNAKFISHLDLDRTMKSALTRAKVTVEHTHGYNPRPYLVFSLPASVGTESVCEFLDIKIPAEDGFAGIPERLNDNLPPDIRVTDAYEPKSDFKEIKYAGYELRIVSPDIDSGSADRITKLFEGPVVIEKRTKKTESGLMDFDISPYIKSMAASYEKDGSLKIETVVSADNATYINPEYIIKAICKYLTLDLSDPLTCLYTVMRTAVYGSDEEKFR